MSQGIHKPLSRLKRPTLLATAAALIALLLLPAAPAFAHDELIGSDPAADVTLDALPPAVTLTFSGVISAEPGATEVQVTDAAGTSLADGEPTTQDNVLTQPLAGDATGAVTVLWRVVSSDGHPISGELAFTVIAAPEPSPTDSSEPPASPTATVHASATAAPEATATPTAPVADDAATVVPWVIFGVIAVAALGAVVYLIVSRLRRDRALERAADDESAPPAER